MIDVLNVGTGKNFSTAYSMKADVGTYDGIQELVKKLTDIRA